MSAWAWAYAVLWALTVAISAVVWAVPGGSGLARAVLGLSLSAARNPALGAGVVVSIAVNNALHAGWPLALGPLGAGRSRAVRTLGDVTVAGNLAVCAVLVGAAVGGYGVRALAYLPHVPLEWAGVAVGATGWLVERRRALGASERTVLLCALAGLLVASGFVEVWAVPHR